MGNLTLYRLKFQKLMAEDEALMSREIFRKESHQARRNELSEELIVLAEAMQREVKKIVGRIVGRKVKRVGDMTDEELKEVLT